MMRTGLLIVVALLYSAAVAAIGRRLPRLASVAAYWTALATLVAVLLLSTSTAQRVDGLLAVIGAGRLLFYLALMTQLCGLFLTIMLATSQCARRHWLALGGAGVLMVCYVGLWLRVKMLNLPDMTGVFYGRRVGHPIHHEAYANRAIVEEVAARCRAAGISPARCAMARMATSLITFQRDNLLQDPGYGLVTSWDALIEDAAVEIDQAMAMTAWERALRDGYIAQQVYILMFLVLDCRAYREILLVDEHPRVQAWHQQLAEIIATVMHQHGHATPRYGALAKVSGAVERCESDTRDAGAQTG